MEHFIKLKIRKKTHNNHIQPTQKKRYALSGRLMCGVGQEDE
jgi:hypothetical protein